jgi:electron transport complex protein RnfA
MASIREDSELVTVPEIAKGTALTFIIAGCLSLAFMGFAGMLSAS